MKVVYSKKYEIAFDHVWPVKKYSMVLAGLLNQKLIQPEDVIYVEAATDDEVRLVHTPDYVNNLKNLSLSPQDLVRLELQLTRQTVDFYWAFAAGTIMACRTALEDGICVHLGGGMHHAFANYGSGFCMLNDIAIGLRKAQHDGLIERAMVIDCDVHQGDGTAKIFEADDSVFTFSIHQRDNFPFFKQKSSLDIELDDGTTDQLYLDNLQQHLPKVITSFKPELIIYVAGADVYKFDWLGGLNLTIPGIAKRDHFVINQAKANSIPLAIVMAGGYAANPDYTAAIHFNTVRTALQTWPMILP